MSTPATVFLQVSKNSQVARKKNHGDAHEGRDLEGRYANYFKVGYNAFEFVIDFGQYYAEDPKARLHTRIITGPSYAKALLEFLQECLDKYEMDYGIIAGNTSDYDQHME